MFSFQRCNVFLAFMISSSIVVSTGGFTLLSPNRFNNVNSIQLQKHHQHHHQHHHQQQHQQHNIINNRYVQYLSMSSKNDEKEEMKQDEDDEEQTPMENQGLSFEDATAALKAEDDADRMAARGAMLEEVRAIITCMSLSILSLFIIFIYTTLSMHACMICYFSFQNKNIHLISSLSPCI